MVHIVWDRAVGETKSGTPKFIDDEQATNATAEALVMMRRAVVAAAKTNQDSRTAAVRAEEA